MDLSKEDKELYKKMGNNLATIRGDKTQNEIANVIGMKTTNYNTIEAKKGERHLKDFQLIKLAKHYNTSTDFLLGLTNIQTTDLETKTICNKYGLTENSLMALGSANRKGEDWTLSAEINTINYLLEDLNQNNSNSIIASISRYLYLDTNFKIIEKTKMFGSDVPVNINLNGESLASAFLKNVEVHLINAREHIKSKYIKKEGENDECKRKSKK